MKRTLYYLLLLAILTGCSQLPKSISPLQTSSEVSATDLLNHIKYLSDDERAGRYPGSKGSQEAVNYIVDNFKAKDVLPAGTNGFLQPFEFIIGINFGGQNYLSNQDENYVINKDFIPLEFSSNGKVESTIVFAGYGFSINDSIQWNDYDGIDADGKWVLILRGGPGGRHPHSDFAKNTPIRKKAMLARDQNAAGILFVNQDGDEDQLIPLKHSPNSTAIGIPVLQVSRNIANQLLDQKLIELQNQLDEKHSSQSFLLDKEISAEVTLKKEIINVPNVIGLIPGNDSELKNEYIVIGAHFDHLGFGGKGSGSLTPDSNAIHNGADDNASGTAGILELAEKLSANRKMLKRSILLMAYNAEEEGLLGSKYFVNNPTVDFSKITAMINMDMIGRMSEDKITIGGTGTSPQFESILNETNQKYNLNLKMSKEGYGPSDHASFYVNDVPVLFFFTGNHTDYHKPSDDWQQINAEGEKKIVDLIYDLILRFSRLEEKLIFTEAGPKESNQTRRSFNVTFGLIPSYGSDAVGLEIDGAKKDGPAGIAGLKKGDIITSIGGKDIKNIYDYMYRLAELKPGETVEVKVMRGDDELTLKVIL
jgi:hypothetical protein